MDHVAAQMEKRLNHKFTPFQQGQKVWLKMKHHSDRYPFRKLAPKQHGLFKIQKVFDMETVLDTILRSSQGIQQQGGRRLKVLTCQQAPYAED
jgi:hypothetical protein